MFDAGADPVRPELVGAIDRCWDELGRPGTWWDAPAKIEVAEVARAARGGLAPSGDDSLHPAAADAARRIGATPAAITESWVRDVCDGLGETHYVELIGVVGRVVAVDTFLQLLGHDPLTLPEPADGEQPTREPSPDGLRRNHTWVSMAMPVPPFVLGAVPAAMAAMNDLSELLYMPMDEMADPDWTRGELHRTQVELVAATVSHENECFY